VRLADYLFFVRHLVDPSFPFAHRLVHCQVCRWGDRFGEVTIEGHVEPSEGVKRIGRVAVGIPHKGEI
jgi:hypothetical protein